MVSSQFYVFLGYVRLCIPDRIFSIFVYSGILRTRGICLFKYLRTTFECVPNSRFNKKTAMEGFLIVVILYHCIF